MRIFITGGTGFVGSELVPSLARSEHEIVLLVRPSEKAQLLPDNVEVIAGESTQEGDWQDAVSSCDGAINMAGHPIFGRWSVERKRQILESRIFTTRNLVAAMPENKPFRFISTSAVGFYGDGGDSILDETAPPGNDFLSSVAVKWEEEANSAREKGTSVAIARFGIVLSKGGGAFEQLERVSKFGVFGPIGDGKQWFSWVHRTDLVRIISFLIEHMNIEGPVNCCAPEPVRQAELARSLGSALNRPAFMAVPSFGMRLLLGEFADTVLFSQRMVPKRLMEEGFEFKFPDLDSALADLV